MRINIDLISILSILIFFYVKLIIKYLFRILCVKVKSIDTSKLYPIILMQLLPLADLMT